MRIEVKEKIRIMHIFFYAHASAEILRCLASDYQNHAGFDFAWQSMDGSLIQVPTRKKGST
jgi:hypothetical protein